MSKASGIIENLQDPKVSMSWFDNEILENARHMNTTPHFDISDLDMNNAKLLQSAEGAEMDFERQKLQTTNDTPIYRLDENTNEQQLADIVSLDVYLFKEIELFKILFRNFYWNHFQNLWKRLKERSPNVNDIII